MEKQIFMWKENLEILKYELLFCFQELIQEQQTTSETARWHYSNNVNFLMSERWKKEVHTSAIELNWQPNDAIAFWVE